MLFVCFDVKIRCKVAIFQQRRKVLWKLLLCCH